SPDAAPYTKAPALAQKLDILQRAAAPLTVQPRQQLRRRCRKTSPDILYPQHVAYREKLPRVRQRGSLLHLDMACFVTPKPSSSSAAASSAWFVPFSVAALRNECAYIRIHAVLFPPPVRPFLKPLYPTCLRISSLLFKSDKRLEAI
ncbi:MAG: hypothetical protein V8S72_04710, partial [Oscillospiraceae bacterium]